MPDYEKSFKKYEKAYELNQGDSEILFMLGLMHSYGVGCELDDPKVRIQHFFYVIQFSLGINVYGGIS